MKRFRIVLFTFIFLWMAASSAFATNVYVDLTSGNDSTGDGSAGSPYKTVDKALDGLGGGDEVRVKKTTITALSGTLTFTNGSKSVTTSEDLSGTLSNGKLIGKNSGVEGWWSVASCTSNTITLDHEYWGASGAASGYYITPESTSYADWNRGTDGASKSSRIKITGGWDLSTTTRDGYTTTVTTTVYGALPVYSDYSEYAYFIAFNDYSSTSNGAVYFDSAVKEVYIHDCHWATGTSNGSGVYTHYNASAITIENCIGSRGGTYNIYISCTGFYIKDSTLYGASASTYGSAYLLGTGNVFIENVDIYNSEGRGIYVYYDAGDVFIKDVVIDTTGSTGIALFDAQMDIYISDTSLNNIGASGIYVYPCNRVYLKDISYSNITSNNISLASPDSGNYSLSPHLFSITSGVHINQSRWVAVTQTTSGDDTYMKVTPKDSSSRGVQNVKAGVVKVTSDSSDLTLTIEATADATYTGRLLMFATQDFRVVVMPEEKTVTTTPTDFSIVVDSDDLEVGEYITLWVGVTGDTGYVMFDDFTYSQ